jgi:hypothetical protein
MKKFLFLLLLLPTLVQAQFTYVTNNSTITITGYTGPGGAVTIPDTLDGLPVTCIGSNAFEQATSVTNITISTNVTSILDWAFYYCSSLTEITIPGSVTNLGPYGFEFCSSLTNVIILNGLTRIENSTFGYCHSLSSVELPESIASIDSSAFGYCDSLTHFNLSCNVTNLGMEVFYGCSSLVAINVDVLNPVYSSASGIVFNKDQTALVQYPPALRGGYLVPDTVTSIKDRAFSGCGGLTSITITTNIVSIGSYAFYDCILTNVEIPSSVTSLSTGLFELCHSLAHVSLPNTLTNIGMSAFSDCSSLNGVIIPAGVSTIGPYAFFTCDSLTSLTVPNNVTNIGPRAFASCVRLVEINVGSLNPYYTSASGVLFDKTLTVLLQCPGGKSGGYAIPGSVKYVGDDAFTYCINLTGISIPTSVTNLGTYAFANSALRSVTVPGSITSWGNSTFQSCTSLTNAVILDGVTSIGNAAFYLCSSLTNVVIPNTVTNLGSSAFANCSRLARVILSDNLVSIGAAAFRNCVKLTSVTIPDSVVLMAYEAFQNCTALPGIYFKGNPPALGSFVFNGDNKATVYYLPSTTGWGTTFGDLPAVLWNPQVQTTGNNFGVRTNKYGFTIAGTSNLVIVVESCTNLGNPSWTPVGTNTLRNGLSYFSDARWTNYPTRFYRLRSP